MTAGVRQAAYVSHVARLSLFVTSTRVQEPCRLHAPELPTSLIQSYSIRLFLPSHCSTVPWHRADRLRRPLETSTPSLKTQTVNKHEVLAWHAGTPPYVCPPAPPRLARPPPQPHCSLLSTVWCSARRCVAHLSMARYFCTSSARSSSSSSWPTCPAGTGRSHAGVPAQKLQPQSPCRAAPAASPAGQRKRPAFQDVPQLSQPEAR
jgi:hypothetical protein